MKKRIRIAALVALLLGITLLSIPWIQLYLTPEHTALSWYQVRLEPGTSEDGSDARFVILFGYIVDDQLYEFEEEHALDSPLFRDDASDPNSIFERDIHVYQMHYSTLWPRVHRLVLKPED